jgi:hypothetical protein
MSIVIIVVSELHTAMSRINAYGWRARSASHPMTTLFPVDMGPVYSSSAVAADSSPAQRVPM